MRDGGDGGIKHLVILGSTGSIGRQALEVVQAHRDHFQVLALTAHANLDLLLEQARHFSVPCVGVTSPQAAAAAGHRLRERGVEMLAGREALPRLASLPEADTILNAVVGSAGLEASLAALQSGKTLALANKESLVAGGPLVLEALKQGGRLVPVDSEHCAIFQCLRGERADEVESIVLTASGGPFYGRTRDELERVSVAEALAHPTWNMGRKITIDSATLMNKGLEVIEAHFLFGVPYDRIQVVAHPQSVIHSLVRFRDGAIMAQLSSPDMRLPISFGLSYPERWEPAWRATDLASLGPLTFGEVDTDTFTCLRLAYEAGRLGGTAPAVLNAANEVAVEAFLGGSIGFTAIGDIVEKVVKGHQVRRLDSLSDVEEAESEARGRARELAEEMGRN
jgi:1-deoxy-D-xylulose-5-phosphate reductoisomerase